MKVRQKDTRRCSDIDDDDDGKELLTPSCGQLSGRHHRYIYLQQPYFPLCSRRPRRNSDFFSSREIAIGIPSVPAQASYIQLSSPGHVLPPHLTARKVNMVRSRLASLWAGCGGATPNVHEGIRCSLIAYETEDTLRQSSARACCTRDWSRSFKL